MKRKRQLSILEELARLQALPPDELRDELARKSATQRLNLAGTTGVLVKDGSEWAPIARQLESAASDDLEEQYEKGRDGFTDLLGGLENRAGLWGALGDLARTSPESVLQLAFYALASAQSSDGGEADA